MWLTAVAFRFLICTSENMFIIHQNMTTVLGWDSKRAETDMNYTNSLIHPDDLPLLFKAGMYYISLGFALPDKKK